MRLEPRLGLLLLEHGGCLGLGEAAERLRAAREAAVEAAAALPGVEVGEDRVCLVDRLALAVHLVSKLNVDPRRVAGLLDWRLFEQHAARAFEEAGYTVYRSLRLHGPQGFEVDVLAVDTAAARAVAVECKHWSPRTSSPSRVAAVAARHLERVRRLAAAWQRLGLPTPRRGRVRVVPVLLVLREHGLPRVAFGVPVVPVSRLRGFIEALDWVVEDPRVATVEAPARGEAD